MAYRHEWIERWLCYYITTRNYVGSGRSHTEWIVNAFKMGVYVIAGLYFIGIDVRNAQGNPYVLCALSLGFLIFNFFLGWGWDKIKGYEISSEWGNKRNPMLREMSKKIKDKI